MRACLYLIIACLLAAGVSAAQQPAPPQTVEAGLQAAKEKLDAGKFQEAEDAFRKVAQIDASPARGMLGVVGVYLAQKRYDDAIALLQSESKIYPNNLEYRYRIGEIALVSRKYDLAVSEFLFVLNRTSKNGSGAGELYFRIGQAYNGQGKPDFAIIFLRQARELLPTNSKVATALALTLEVSGKKEAAARAYRAALDLDPDNAVLLNNLAFSIADQGGNLDTALAYAKRARQLAPNADSVADTLGWVSLKKNLTDEAIALFREAVQKEPARSTYRYHLAMALEQKGDHAGALEELQAALKNNPPQDEEPKIRELMAKIGNQK